MSWQAAAIDEIGSSLEPGWWRTWAREEDYGAGWHSIGDHLGIEGFGVNANTADAGRELIVPHDEVSYGGQEELYIVLRGRARFTCDGEDVELAPGGLVLITAEVRREAVALESPTVVLCVGGTPGRPYEPD